MSFVLKGRVTSSKPFFEKGQFKMYGFLPNDSCLDKVMLSDWGNVTIKGELPTMVEDKEYEMEVEYEKKGNYEAYVVKRFITNPMNMNGTEAFNFLSEFVSENIAENILKEYPNFIQLIMDCKKHKIDIDKIKGVGQVTLDRIEQRIKDNIMFYDIINEFKDYELTLSQVKKIYETCKSVEKLKNEMQKNPYKCLCSIGGIGFKTADTKILNKYRNLIDSEKRMAECILYYLSENESSGHTWIKSNDLYSQCAKTTSQCMKHFNSIINSDKRIKYNDIDKSVTRTITYQTELEIAKLLLQFNKNHRLIEDVDLSKYTKVDTFSLTEKQQLSAEYACKYNMYILAGHAGTGKTASTKALLNMLDDYGYSYILCAPTGKASKNFTLNTGRQASTIHRALQFSPNKGFIYNEENKLQYDFVIVDEATMIDIYLMTHLLRAINHKYTKLIFICEPAQIPSVGCGNCIQDMINSNIFPMIFLDKVFRYNEGGISKIATDTRNGKEFLTGDGVEKFGDDFVFVPTNKENLINKIVSAYKKVLNMGATVDEIAVLSAYNVGEFGTHNINSIIQNLVNPSKGDMEVSYVKKQKNNTYTVTLKVNDRVMQIVNNYSAEVFTNQNQKTDLSPITEVFNGDDGKIIEIGINNKGQKYIVVDFDGTLVMYRDGSFNELVLGYAISAHKSQGSGYNYVITITPPTHKYFLNRNLLYVMYTRVKKFMYNIGTADTIESALKKSENLNRRTFLQDFLRQHIK